MDWRIQKIQADGSAAGAPVPFAQLGIESATFQENNLAADVWSLTVGGRELDAAELWPYGQLLAVLDPHGVRRFLGRVEPWSRSGSPDSQNHLGRLVGPWWYLANKIYEQTFRYTVGNYAEAAAGTADPIFTAYTSPRVILNILRGGPETGVHGWRAATTGEQIADAVNWCISQGAPIALGVVDPDMQPFSDQKKGINCADVIRAMFQKEPDFVMDWDYSTLPFPTVHFRKQKSLIPATIDLRAATIREQVSIKDRPDWQRSYVRIIYDQTNTQDGKSYLKIISEIYPNLPADPELRFRGVDLFCDLTGYSASLTTQTAVLASQAADFNSIETWKKWCPAIDKAKHDEIKAVDLIVDSGPGVTIVTNGEYDANGDPEAYDPTCIYELIGGSWCDWIPNVKAQQVRVEATAMITKDKGDSGDQVERVNLSHDMTLVSIDTGGQFQDFIQSQNQVTQFAEQMPAGLAQAMWESWQNLCIEGSFTNVEEIAGRTISRSNCLNFLTAHPGVGGQPDWRNVQALVQSVSGDIARGVTKVEFGAPLRITGYDLIDAIRATRHRITTIDLSYFFGGPLGGGGGSQVKLAKRTYLQNTQAGTPHIQKNTVSANPAPKGGVDAYVRTDGDTGGMSWSPPNGPIQSPVVLDPAGSKGSDGNWHPIQLREVKVASRAADNSCKQRTMIIFGSLIYKAPDDPE